MKCSEDKARSPGRRRLMQAGLLGLPATSLAGVGRALASAAEAGTQAYAGPGYYLYPAWGDPVLYYVSELSGSPTPATLAFRDPASGRLLWTQSLAGEAVFAGRLQP
jgi:hypothetical protein